MKLIAYYGEFDRFELARFTKLFGTPGIEAQSLLKNSVASSRYVLITDDLLEGLPTQAASNSPESLWESNRWQTLGHIRKIYVTLFDYEAAFAPWEIFESLEEEK